MGKTDQTLSQPGQTSTSDVKKLDLRAELLLAEHEAKNKKRKAEGKPLLAVEESPVAEDEANKRRKMLQDALEMDKDDEDDEDEEEGHDKPEADADKDDEERCVLGCPPPASRVAHVCIYSEEDSDEEDDTAELLRELEKIKRERAEEKERIEREKNATEAVAREEEIATSNPLLNLAAALGQNPVGINTNAPGTFAVKRRWDDGEWPTAFCRFA
jgi:protein CWC15